MRLKVTDQDGNKQTIDARSIVLDDGSFLGGTGGVLDAKITSTDVARAESLYYVDQFVATVAAVGATSPLGILALPYKELIFTKSNTAETVTINVNFTINGGILTISGLTGETMLIEANDQNDNDLGTILVVNSAGNIVSAATLGDGTYYLYLGK